jgi:hypothetical protein
MLTTTYLRQLLLLQYCDTQGEVYADGVCIRDILLATYTYDYRLLLVEDNNNSKAY